MIIVVVWLLLAMLVGVYASNKGNSGFGYFVIAVLLSPLLGFIIAAVSKPNKTELEKREQQRMIQSKKYKKCIHCAEMILAEAKICKHCGKEVEQAHLSQA